MDRYELSIRTSEAQGRASVMASILGSEASIDRSLADRDLDEASYRVDRLLLVVDALWDLVRDEGLTDEDLRRRLDELEQSVAAGSARPAARCRSCDSVLDESRPTCAICGEPIPRPN
jgi:hypothetical protein